MEKTKKLAVGILAHVDAGKTTLAEGILYKTGQIRKAGRVDHKDAFLDTEELEKARGITIFSKQAVLKLNETEVTLLDTPGHVDFSAEMERTLQVMDYAVLLISGADGVQGHVETLWRPGLSLYQQDGSAGHGCGKTAGRTAEPSLRALPEFLAGSPERRIAGRTRHV